MISVSDRYRNDPKFHHFVDLIYNYMTELELTPSEMREAVMLAAIKFETLNIKPILMNHEGMRKYNEMRELCEPRISSEFHEF